MTTTFLPLVSKISESFNHKKPALRTVVIAVDISKVFDTVDTTLLLDMISSSDLCSNLVRWLSTYFRGRYAASTYQGCRSKFWRVHVGVPQGSVLSPVLFNNFVSDFPVPSQDLSSFADDFSVAAYGLNLQVMRRLLILT
jgi:retron-type reverse transcriptase